MSGMVKQTYLAQRFPHAFPSAAVLYGVSSVHHPDALAIVDAARKRGVPFVQNQSGVYYRAWFGDAWEEYNREMAALLHRADFVVYQSEFCRRAAMRFLNAEVVRGCVLYNPVDLTAFRPQKVTSRPLTLLAAAWRLGLPRSPVMDTVVETLRFARQGGKDVHLVIAGYSPAHTDDAFMMGHIRSLADSAGIPQDRLRFLPRYSRRDAPAVFAHGDIFLHAVYNDASPNVVGEALASGLPVVFSATGGTPEIVGPAGIGIPSAEDWEVSRPPAPEALAMAVHTVVQNLTTYAGLARSRAESLLDLDGYLRAHETIFRDVGSTDGSGGLRLPSLR